MMWRLTLDEIKGLEMLLPLLTFGSTFFPLVLNRIGEQVVLMADIIRSLGRIEVSKRSETLKRQWVWKPLTLGFIKINVDDYFLGVFEQRWYRGIFRNSEGDVLLQFCKEVYVDLAIYAEVLPLREGLLVVVVDNVTFFRIRI